MSRFVGLICASDKALLLYTEKEDKIHTPISMLWESTCVRINKIINLCQSCSSASPDVLPLTGLWAVPSWPSPGVTTSLLGTAWWGSATMPTLTTSERSINGASIGPNNFLVLKRSVSWLSFCSSLHQCKSCAYLLKAVLLQCKCNRNMEAASAILHRNGILGH